MESGSYSPATRCKEAEGTGRPQKVSRSQLSTGPVGMAINTGSPSPAPVPQVTSPEKIKEEFLSFTEEGAVDLCRIARFVKHHCNLTVPLVKPRSCTLRICGLKETVYEGDEEQLEAWKYYYLPERMEMEVIGAIDDFPCDAFGLQLVILLGEDGRVFACEDELLHLVARNLRDLLQNEMAFPGIETFKLGECFEEPTEEEYLEMMESVDVKEMKKQHMKFRESLEFDLLNTMNEITQSHNNP
ncbi:uncharacterized protein LOC113075700 [Carassius auratus]|uniref:Uncharacterized protein LOC113075700 n=1 Tax=Carassius auratus TaxID=7957 RepID=A0A6P6N508_CARAU|nr:uncharacterized protein LOC113075700 [Carassius auratus]